MGDAPRPTGDPRYGRLFTLSDVRLLMHRAALLTSQQLERLISTMGDTSDAPTTSAEAIGMMEELLNDVSAEGNLTLPADEPILLVRASDDFAPAVLAAMAIAKPEAGDLITELGKAMAAWRNPTPEEAP